MWQLFFVLYFMYLILGPWWETKLLKGEPMNIVKSPQEFFRRSVFISYVSLLFTAWFLYRPSRSSYMNALMLSLFATIMYYVKYGREPGYPMHVLLNVFILLKGKTFLDQQTFLTFMLVFFYMTFHKVIY